MAKKTPKRSLTDVSLITLSDIILHVFLAFWKCLHGNILCVLSRPKAALCKNVFASKPEVKGTEFHWISWKQQWVMSCFPIPIIYPDGLQLQGSRENTFSDWNFNIPVSVRSNTKKIHLPLLINPYFSHLLFPHTPLCSLPSKVARLWDTLSASWVFTNPGPGVTAALIVSQKSASVKCVYINVNACTRRVCSSEID